MYGYIYETTNLINGKKYIGRHKSEVFDSQYYGSGIYITRAIAKYGKEHFKVEMLEEVLTGEHDLNEREKYWIKYYNAQKSDKYYNIADGGIGGDVYSGYSEEDKQAFKNKVSKGLKEFHKNNPDFQTGERNPMYDVHKYGKDAPFYGHHHNEQSKLNIGLSQKGKIVSDETCEKLRIAHSGKIVSNETREKISKSCKGRTSPMKGKHLSDSAKELIRQKNLGKFVSEETRRKQSNSAKGKILSEETKEKIRESKKYLSEESRKKLSDATKGARWITNGIDSQRLLKDKNEINRLLNEGWFFGILKKKEFTQEHKDNLKKAWINRKNNSTNTSLSSTYGRKRITKDGIVKYVEIKDIDKFISCGWTIGGSKNGK